MNQLFDRMMAVYEGRTEQPVVFQPRIKHWYDVNLVTGTLPKRYHGQFLDEIYQSLNVTPREVWCPGGSGSDLGGYLPLTVKESDEVEVWVRQAQGLYYEADESDYIITEYRTPKGTIRQIQRRTEHGTSLYNSEYFLKDLKDIEVFKYVLQDRQYLWNQRRFEWGMARYGETLPLRLQLQHSPLMWLIVRVMGFQRTVVMLWRHPKEMEELLELLEQEYFKMLSVCKGKPIVEISFGDNMHHDMCTPPLFKKYVIPFYQRAMAEVHKMGMYGTSHWDGYIKQLLPLVQETHLDGLECVTPLPQGDVTLSEIKKGLGDMFLRDGIPAVLMCPWSTLTSLEKHVQRVLELFHPRLILGISDLLPANGDIRRIRFVNQIVQEFNAKL
jgi:hypothetical protein